MDKDYDDCREWGPTGFGDYPIIKLDTGIKGQITEQIKKDYPGTTIPNEFFSSIESAISMFRVQEKIKDDSLPGAVRTNLKKSMEAAKRLLTTINALDGNSNQLIQEIEKEIYAYEDKKLPQLNTSQISIQECSPLLRSIYTVIDIIGRAQWCSENYPNKNIAYHRIYFAHDIAEAIEQHLMIKPTDSRDDLYVVTLTLLMNMITGKDESSLYKLAEQGLQVIKNDNNSLVEWIYNPSI